MEALLGILRDKRKQTNILPVHKRQLLENVVYLMEGLLALSANDKAHINGFTSVENKARLRIRWMNSLKISHYGGKIIFHVRHYWIIHNIIVNWSCMVSVKWKCFLSRDKGLGIHVNGHLWRFSCAFEIFTVFPYSSLSLRAIFFFAVQLKK